MKQGKFLFSTTMCNYTVQRWHIELHSSAFPKANGDGINAFKLYNVNPSLFFVVE